MRSRATTTLAALLLSFTSYSSHGETASGGPGGVPPASGGDHRQLVSLPDEARELMRTDMLDHLAALNEIITHLASGNLDAAAEVAEQRMGRSSMGKHRGTGMGPGRFMPPEMRSLGLGMHDAASELADVARLGDLGGSYATLQKVTGMCVACHYSYRTR